MDRVGCCSCYWYQHRDWTDQLFARTDSGTNYPPTTADGNPGALAHSSHPRTAAGTFVYGFLLRNYAVGEMFLAAVSLAVAAIPKDYPQP